MIRIRGSGGRVGGIIMQFSMRGLRIVSSGGHRANDTEVLPVGDETGSEGSEYILRRTEHHNPGSGRVRKSTASFASPRLAYRPMRCRSSGSRSQLTARKYSRPWAC